MHHRTIMCQSRNQSQFEWIQTEMLFSIKNLCRSSGILQFPEMTAFGQLSS